MGFFSFKVTSPVDDLVIPEFMVVVGEGLNVFNLTLDDPAPLVSRLVKEGCDVLEVIRLDELERVTPEMSLLPSPVEQLGGGACLDCGTTDVDEENCKNGFGFHAHRWPPLPESE